VAGGNQALRQAIDLVHVPTLAHRFRGEPLAEGVELLLAIAAGDEASEHRALMEAERDRETVLEAATFFIQQVLFSPDADHYRILGATPEAGRDELRRNFTQLMRWLHPDVDRGGGHAVFLGRVMEAWDTLKTPEGRRAYDAGLLASEPRPAAAMNGANSKAAAPNAIKAKPSRSVLRRMAPPRRPMPPRLRRPNLLGRALARLLGGP